MAPLRGPFLSIQPFFFLSCAYILLPPRPDFVSQSPGPTNSDLASHPRHTDLFSSMSSYTKVMAEGEKNQGVKQELESLECGTSLAEREHATAENIAPPLSHQSSQTSVESITSVQDLRSALASDVLTSGGPIETFTSPFEVPASKKDGNRYLTVPLVYCDQTASNRPVRSIERYMEQTCLPLYGNTHTNTSITGSQSTAFVAEARQIVAEATNAKITGKASLDVVLFS